MVEYIGEHLRIEKKGFPRLKGNLNGTVTAEDMAEALGRPVEGFTKYAITRRWIHKMPRGEHEEWPVVAYFDTPEEAKKYASTLDDDWGIQPRSMKHE